MKRSDSSYSKIIRAGKNYNASFISTTIRKFLFSFSIISILLTSVSAQTNFKSGYVVKVGNDTLKGYLDDRGDIRNAKLIVYKAELNANPVTYYPNDLLGFEIGNNFYISHKIKTEQTELIVFLNVIETGRISLYMYRDKLSADHFYVKKDSSFQALTNEIIKYYSDGAAFQKKSKKYYSILRYLINDCDKLRNDQYVFDFTLTAIARVIKTYNECFQQGPVYSSEKSKKKVHVETIILAGLNIANVSVSGSSPTVTDPSKIYGLSLGIRGKFFFPTFSNKISLDLGVAYNKKGASFTKDKAEFNLNYMDLYTLIKYNYPKGKIRPTIGVGGLYGMLLKKNNAYSGANGDLFVDNTVKTEIGYVIEAGFNYLLNDAHQIVVILGYEKTTIPFNFLLQGYGNNVIGLKVGYSF